MNDIMQCSMIRYRSALRIVLKNPVTVAFIVIFSFFTITFLLVPDSNKQRFPSEKSKNLQPIKREQMFTAAFDTYSRNRMKQRSKFIDNRCNHMKTDLTGGIPFDDRKLNGQYLLHDSKAATTICDSGHKVL